MPDAPPLPSRIDLPGPDDTARLGRRLVRGLLAGDSVLLTGPIGAGKSHLARALIAAAQAAAGEPPEDIPSPSYTLVQTYRAGPVEIWHADLYRLGDPGEIAELGLDDAFGRALCVVEWADRLPPHLVPRDALRIDLAPAGDGRTATLSASGATALRFGLAAAGCAHA